MGNTLNTTLNKVLGCIKVFVYMNTHISLYFNVIYVFVFDCFRVLVYG